MKDNIPRLEIIDTEKWPRHAYFQHYSTLGKCAFNVTGNLDVSHFLLQCKNENIKFYPIFVSVISHVVNALPEFRMGVDEQGQPGIWNYVSPCYMVFHDEDKTFSCLFSEYSIDRNVLYQRIVENIDRFKNTKGLFPQPLAQNSFNTSCLPWLDFAAFSLNLYGDSYLLPIITWGRYSLQQGKTLLPLSVQIHHAAADGYHVSLFYEKLQDELNKTWPKQ